MTASYQVRDGVAVLTTENPPVNALSHAVRDGLLQGIGKAQADDAVSAIVIIGGGRTFPAGADIREFNKPKQAPSLQDVLAAIENCPKPVIAAIHGTALGGGLETALACGMRVASPSAKVGLPEVKLGLLPGAGGTQRLTRIVGPQAALDIITTGKQVDAAKARDYGIVDELVEGDLLEGAVAIAARVAKAGTTLVPVRDRSDKIGGVDAALFDKARRDISKKTPSFKAPLAIVDCIQAAVEQPFEQGLAFEQEKFQELVKDTQHKALSHLFFAEREAAKVNGVTGVSQPKTVGSVGIVGAGTMGGGIGMSFLNAGIPVTIVDASDKAIEVGLGRIKENYARSVSRGSTTQARVDAAMGRLKTSTSYDDLADADMVIEAVYENMDVKQDVFRKLDKVAKKGAVLASNTSTLDVDKISSVLEDPTAFIGMHFFSPANVMKLLENVRAAKSSGETIATVMSIARTIGKVPVLAGNCDGFIGNRILHAYGRQADMLIEEGATPWQIDGVLKTFGLPMGLYLMRDMAGLDVGWRIREERAKIEPPGPGYTSTVADRICEMGRFGQKTGSGYYKYEGRDATPDPEIEALILKVSEQRGVARRQISDDEILKRIIYAMVNEGAEIVSEGIAQRASDIDIVYCNGYGFPQHLGGPMFWAEQQGLADVLETIRGYQQSHGSEWKPAALLEEAAVAGHWPSSKAA